MELGPVGDEAGDEGLVRGLPEDVWRNVRRLFVAVAGGTVLLIGVAMLVLPGPAVLVIPAGLAILATEFLWARRWLRRAKAMFDKARQSAKAAGDDGVAGFEGAAQQTGPSWWRRFRRRRPRKTTAAAGADRGG
ncbi:MAG TPA: PGPGW domain-containing protein [Verrucomicrobiota bacterium]|nr:PGPGW domain-containing protein [Verrucomicrobiota bacterium]HNU49696.1 PGPGW domain-containing protein [Verrucomicrobiota bacterium]